MHDYQLSSLHTVSWHVDTPLRAPILIRLAIIIRDSCQGDDDNYNNNGNDV
jgi:hypothetical protein